MRRSTIITLCCLAVVPALAQPAQKSPQATLPLAGVTVPLADTLTGWRVGENVLALGVEADVPKALYGRIAGLNVYQGTGNSSVNLASLSLHGFSPLILVDGFPRDIHDLTLSEITSIEVLKDATSAALYGIRGANGVVLVTTKRGIDQPLKITAKYQIGVTTPFRNPNFADSYTYATAYNAGLASDGLALRYTDRELQTFRDGSSPYYFPNVDWWKETHLPNGIDHQLNLTFNGGNERFRYYADMLYYYDQSMANYNTTDDRYNNKPTDTRLQLRANIDVDITRSTLFRLGLSGRLKEVNGPNGAGSLYTLLYQIPSAVFPVKYENGIWGGSSAFGNPVAMQTDGGHYKTVESLLAADMRLTQSLDAVTRGLSAEIGVSLDNKGSMYESSSQTYRMLDMNARQFDDGTIVTTPVIIGTDSELLGHSQSFSNVSVSSDVQFKLAYDRDFGCHHVKAGAFLDRQSVVLPTRNLSRKRQSFTGYAAYAYKERYILNAVYSYSGSAYLPDGDKYRSYPAVSAGWVISEEKFMSHSGIDWLKLTASYGISGWDGNLTHELWRQSFDSSNAGGYYFGNNATLTSGLAEGNLLVQGLTAEKSELTTVGLELRALHNRLSFSAMAFKERRSDRLISAANSVSGVLGISAGSQNAGINDYRGFDVSVGWSDSRGSGFSYGVQANMAYLESKMVNENEAYQTYGYLYRKGNPVGQSYGLEAIGFFADQREINNSPVQTFSTVKPGDIKYKDQNGDGKIDAEDVVRMFGTRTPRFYFGFNLNVGYKGIALDANFQGMTGVTVNLLDSPLYKPLVGNTTISDTFLGRETPWTADNAANATMPRLTTLANANNYRNSSLFYRDGSFIKLRELRLSYTLSKKYARLADIQFYIQGNNLFSLDNIGFADPEQFEAAYPSVRSYWAGIKFNF